MASGDVTVSIAVEGGVTKSATFDSATRAKIKTYVTENLSLNVDVSADADWQVYQVNLFAGSLVAQANKQLASETSYTAKSFVVAS
tara:strand:- start:37 stop:294 length:258 start_codon:yes stop_codon:yes gene_type:complete